jgi:hypothetical protein
MKTVILGLIYDCIELHFIINVLFIKFDALLSVVTYSRTSCSFMIIDTKPEDS